MSRRRVWDGARRNNRGLSMVELLIAVFLVTFVTGAAGFIYLTNERSLRQGREKLLVQQNATFCLEEMTRDLRKAWRVDHVNGSKLVLYNVGGFSYSTLELVSVSGENRVFKNGISVVPEECTILMFSVLDADTSSIGIDLELRDDNDNRVRIANTVKLRNHEVAGPS